MSDTSSGKSPKIVELEFERDEARHQLAEAAEAVRLLLELLRMLFHDGISGEEWDALPTWMRKEIER